MSKTLLRLEAVNMESLQFWRGGGGGVPSLILSDSILD